MFLLALLVATITSTVNGALETEQKVLKESQEQWADSKQTVREILGGGSIPEQIAFEEFTREFDTINLPFPKQRLKFRYRRELNKKKFFDTHNMDPAFYQKAERVFSQKVSWQEVVDSLAEEMFVEYSRIKYLYPKQTVKYNVPSMGSATFSTHF